jgi:hypothetical protein
MRMHVLPDDELIERQRQPHPRGIEHTDTRRAGSAVVTTTTTTTRGDRAARQRPPPPHTACEATATSTMSAKGLPAARSTFDCTRDASP